MKSLSENWKERKKAQNQSSRVLGKNCLRFLRDIKKRAFEEDSETKRAFSSFSEVLSFVVLLTLFCASSKVFKEKNLFVVAGEWSESEIILLRV